MRKSASHELQQCYNAQAAVDADRGYANGAEVAVLQEREVKALVATAAEGRRRAHDLRPEPAPHKRPTIRSAWRLAMRARLEQPQARAKYRLRKQAVEPVFGVLKRVMGFTHFRLRRLAGVSLEWQLATLAYNCRRVHRLQTLAGG